MTEPQQIRRRAFVLRIWQDESGHVWGQVAEPSSEWRQPFAGLEELWAILLAHLDIPSDLDDPTARDGHR